MDVLTPDSLMEAGIRGVLVDLDNTLVPRDEACVPVAARTWVAGLLEADIGVCIVSNNWHHRVADAAAELGCVGVAKALKPMPFGFWKGGRMLQLSPRELAVVGDQVFTDVLGGNLIGATSVLVQRLSGTDLPHTVLLRRLEAWIMAGRAPEKGASGETTKGPLL